jgi:hypothetical protein
MEISVTSVYNKLEKVLKQAKEPLTCVDLYERTEIRATAESANDVSNRLGYMFRRGLLTRLPAPRTGTKSARFAYTWRKEVDLPKEPVTVDDVKPKRIHGFDVSQEKDGSVTLTTKDLEITVRRR